MKKILLFLCAIFFTANVFATGIGANDTTASCDNETLGQTSGTANVEIDWQPNNINITWYNDDTQLTVQSSAQSCVYDDDLYLPAAPTKTGYTFKGWTLRRTTCDIENLDIYVEGSSRGFISDDGKRIENIEEYGLTDKGQWGVTFSYGKVIGESLCSISTGTHTSFDNPDSVNAGNHCWCRVTGFLSNDGKRCSVYPKPSLWMYYHDYEHLDTCKNLCAVLCSYVEYYDSIRSALFKGVGL